MSSKALSVANKKQFEDTRSQLQDDVNKLYERLAELQIELSNLQEGNQTVSDETDPSTLIFKQKEKQLSAEVDFAQSIQNNRLEIPDDVYLSEEELKKDLKNDYHHLKETREFVRAQGHATQVDEENEKQYNEELQQAHEFLERKLTEISNAQQEGNNYSETDMEQRKLKIYAYTKTLMKQMAKFANKHFPQPSEESIETWQHKQKQMTGKRRTGTVPSEFASLKTLLERLMNSSIENPNDSYITIDDTHWPPYLEMLLRFGMALRHPTNSNKIKLTPFHL